MENPKTTIWQIPGHLLDDYQKVFYYYMALANLGPWFYERRHKGGVRLVFYVPWEGTKALKTGGTKAEI